MSGLLGLLFMSACLGLGCFGFGIIPLSVVLPKNQMAKLSTIGNGLLLGTALGVIIPEGIETLASAYPKSDLPTRQIALSLLFGFTFMLVVEQLLSPHSHSPPSNTLPVHNGRPAAAAPPEVQFDAGTELGELELEQGFGYIENNSTPGRGQAPDEDPKRKAYPLTLGLVVHGLADGLALGVSALSTSNLGALSDLSLVVFLALIVHKGPTALALTTSLLATSLPRAECKRHIIFFSASTPLGAIVSYTIFSILGAGKGGNWTGVALLVSGGTFLYVATVLQPVGHHKDPESSKDDMSDMTRVAFLVFGMTVPFAISQLVGHGH
ncbi:hypothetical protein PLICRDRAFT_107070 [Plicaturopsis crispa FD-325 SS-3]|nr:hypothetical protein PLICRDRAFT_107070 [Plicaturopsis crispa FD-325 SS-3]